VGGVAGLGRALIVGEKLPREADHPHGSAGRHASRGVLQPVRLPTIQQRHRCAWAPCQTFLRALCELLPLMGSATHEQSLI